MFSLGTIVNSQEKLETMLMQNLGGQTKSIMVFFEVSYICRVALRNCQPSLSLNSPFPSSRLPPLQSESKCEVFVMVISSTLHINED